MLGEVHHISSDKLVLGVMALYLNRKRLEERNFFRQLTRYGDQMGINVFVFTPEDVHTQKKQILAHIYDLKRRGWVRRWRPFPDIIFDRCRYQPNKRFEQLRKFRKRYSHLTYLNRPLSNKWIIHQLFYKNEAMQKYLPDTRYYHSMKDLKEMLTKHNTVYFKPINGTGGRGILKINKIKNGRYLIQGREHNRRIISKQQTTESALRHRIKRMRAVKKYTLQQGIDISLENGKVHDYRILFQKNGNGRWEMTGGACRIGPARSITSNLHGGGKAVPMDYMLQKRFNSQQIPQIYNEIKELASTAIHQVETEYGSLCELALDIAIDKGGHVWLLEINPKPAREVFRVIGQYDTYRKAITRPLEYALYVYHNTKRR